MRTVLERELGLENVLIASDEMVKVEIANKKMDPEYNVAFPYSYISLSEIQGVKDQANNKIIRKVGYDVGFDAVTKATTRKAYIFPVTISLDFKYVDNDPYRCLRICEALVILSQMDAIYYDIVLSEQFRFHCRLELPDTEPIPLADTQNAQAPSGMEVSATFILHTFCGIFRDVAAVSSDTPKYSLKIENITGGIQELTNG